MNLKKFTNIQVDENAPKFKRRAENGTRMEFASFKRFITLFEVTFNVTVLIWQNIITVKKMSLSDLSIVNMPCV